MPTKTELRDKLCKLLEAEGVGSDVLAGELVNLIEERGVIRLEPEEPLPTVLDFCGGPIVAMIPDGWTDEGYRVRVLAAMVAAYNERQEINEIEVDVDNAISSGLAVLCREDIDAEERGVQEERARCLAIMDWLLGSLPQGWDFARRFVKAARGKIAGGANQRGAGAAWTGADDLPNPEPPACDCRLCGQKVAPAPALEWPEKLAWDEGEPSRILALYCGATLRAEVDRRWEAEPKMRLELEQVRWATEQLEQGDARRIRELRERIERAETYMRHHWPATLASGQDGVVQKLWRILTGKES